MLAELVLPLPEGGDLAVARLASLHAVLDAEQMPSKYHTSEMYMELISFPFSSD